MNTTPDRDFIIAEIKSGLSGYDEIQFATVFGSLVKDRLTERSDIDIAIAGERSLDVDFKLQLAASLSKKLPYDVDLIDLQSVSGAILQQALCTGVTIKQTSMLLKAQLIKKMWYNQADMMPNTLMCLRKHADRFLNG